MLDTRLIRLQCYEGLDAHSALYEWNYQHQLLAIKLLEQDARPVQDKEQDIFSERYLLKRPLLEAITTTPAPVLLIDEIDRTDEAFEAYLLELLSDFQMSIPELGVIRATERPFVILTSNGTREISDALRRRCLYQYVDYPGFDKELLIVRTQVPEVPEKLARQMVEFVQSVRQMDLQKKPGLAETLDWVAALLTAGRERDRRRRCGADHGFARGAREDTRGSGRHDAARRRKTGGVMLTAIPSTADRAPPASLEDALRGALYGLCRLAARERFSRDLAATWPRRWRWRNAWGNWIASCCAGVCARCCVRGRRNGAVSTPCSRRIFSRRIAASWANRERAARAGLKPDRHRRPARRSEGTPLGRRRPRGDRSGSGRAA